MSETPEEHEQPSELRAALVHHGATTLLLIAALALGIWGYLNFQKQDFFSFQGEKDRRMEEQLIASQERKLTFAVDTYHAIHNEAPSSFEALELDGLITAKDLRYPSRHIVYEMVREDGRMRDQAVARPTSPGLGDAKEKKKARE